MAGEEKLKGTVIAIYLNKGFGFVRGEDGLSRFMHASDVRPRVDFDRMYQGIGVLFTPVDLSDRLAATDIRGNGLRATEVEILA